jgi:outer membrane lipoprotein SlyB
MMQNQGASATPTSPNATVAAIEVLPRSSSSATEGNAGASAMTSNSVGSSAGGATGSSSADRIYRVTLRMDDGSTQVVTQQTTPDFRTGDRVSLAGGMIQH